MLVVMVQGSCRGGNGREREDMELKQRSKLKLKASRHISTKGYATKVPVWVKLHGVPVLAYSDDGLSLIATKIGKPIMLDAFTSFMCVESWGRISFARALIEVSVDYVLKKEVVMAIPNEEDEGYTREVIRVEYEWKPPHCVDCKFFRYESTTCPKRVREAAPKDPTRAPKSTSVEENEDAGKGKGEASKEATGSKKGSVNDKGNGNYVSLKNSFANLMEDNLALDESQNVSGSVNADGNDKGTKDCTNVVNEEVKSQAQDSLWENFKANKEASISKSKFTSFDCDDDSNDDEKVYMPEGMTGGGFMDGLEDDLDCYDGYGTQVYDLTPQ
ncbi:reverse transcriptase domain-containing protein [Tanacetum coccineum]|uniref:Reverse transcriptase domain-containing protein n=1 Tax=Tanacetum coccineum TaxID=301880 RepID=A0ABQ5EGE4_9ASTR